MDKQNKLKVADLTFDIPRWEVKRGGETIHLSFTELVLLQHLMEADGVVIRRKDLMDNILERRKDRCIKPHKNKYIEDSNNIDVYISYLRKKIDKGRKTKLIHSVRHIGYKVADLS